MTLVALRDNLLAGLDRVADAARSGDLHRVGKKGQAPPAQSGCLTLVLLVAVNDALVARGHATVFVEG